MYKQQLCHIFMVIVFMTLGFVAEAKRGPAPKVHPLSIDGVEYRAPNLVSCIGVVEAWDKEKGIQLWEKKAYSYFINPFLEEDVQWVFIAELSFDKNRDELRIVNEKNEIFFISLTPPDKYEQLVYYLVCLFVILILVYSYARHRAKLKSAK